MQRFRGRCPGVEDGVAEVQAGEALLVHGDQARAGVGEGGQRWVERDEAAAVGAIDEHVVVVDGGEMGGGGVGGREAVVVAEEESEGHVVVGVHVGYDAGGEGGVLFGWRIGLGGRVGGHFEGLNWWEQVMVVVELRGWARRSLLGRVDEVDISRKMGRSFRFWISGGKSQRC